MQNFIRASVATALVSSVSGAGCSGQESILANPSDPAAHGPYSVGSLLGSVEVATGRFGRKRSITTEVWYPAPLGSEVGKIALSYDIREHVPAKQQKMLVDAANVTSQACDCFRGLPVADGAFPVVVMVHGTAAFRTASMHQQTHWASRGFVVIAADHPGIQLKDLLGIADIIVPPKTDQEGDTRGLLEAFADVSALEDFAALTGHLDMSRVGLGGHSAGGMALKNMGDVTDVLVSMSGLAPATGDRLKSTLMISAQDDSIVGYDSELKSYESCDAVPRRFAAVKDLGHLFCTDLCWIGASAGGIVQIAEDHGIVVAKAIEGLGQNGCAYLNKDKGTHFLEPECGWAFVNHASTAAFEEVLRCDVGMTDALANIRSALNAPSICPTDMVYEYRDNFTSAVI